MNRFENINKQKEAETQQRIAEERKKRSAVDQSSEQQQPASTKTATPVEVKPKETPREPSPASEPTTDVVEEPVEASQQPTQTDENEQGEVRMVGAVNVAALLRKRRDSSPSEEIPDEEWD